MFAFSGKKWIGWDSVKNVKRKVGGAGAAKLYKSLCFTISFVKRNNINGTTFLTRFFSHYSVYFSCVYTFLSR
jgi:hypothetical protein